MENKDIWCREIAPLSIKSQLLHMMGYPKCAQVLGQECGHIFHGLI